MKINAVTGEVQSSPKYIPTMDESLECIEDINSGEGGEQRARSRFLLYRYNGVCVLKWRTFCMTGEVRHSW